MSELSMLAFYIGVTLYLPLFYLFLAPGFAGYIFAKNRGIQKGLHILAFIIAPLIAPVVILLLLGWWFLKAAFAILFMVLAYPLYWLMLYFPFGGVLKAWYKLSARVLELLRSKLEILLGIHLPPPPKPVDSRYF